MKYLLFIFLILIHVVSVKSQTILWANDFEVPSEWTLNTPTSGTGNGLESNLFVISDATGGVAVPGCQVGVNGNKTLHVACSGASFFCTGPGAIYSAGDNGFGFSDAETHKRTTLNSNINLTGQSTLTLRFDYIGVGEVGLDFGTVIYSTNGGATWNDLQIIPLQTITCGTNIGQWAALSVALPVSCENNPNVRIGFKWDNDNNGLSAGDPSLAINNVRITTPAPGTPPVASFTVSSTTVCSGVPITFTNTSTGTGNSYVWNVTPTTGFSYAGATTSTSTNPQITFTTPGTYVINVAATNGSGNNTSANQSITVNSCAAPTPAFTTSATTACTGGTINFTGTFTGGTPTNWLYSVSPATGVSGTLSTQNASVTFANNGTYSVTLTAANANGANTTVVQTITVATCAIPIPSFTSSNSSICVNGSTTLTGTLTGPPAVSTLYTITPAAGWNFSSGSPIAANGIVTFTVSGTYSIVWSATNTTGTNTTVPQTVVVTVCPPPVASFTVTNSPSCTGAAVAFNSSATTNSPTNFSWSVSPTTGWVYSTGNFLSPNPSITFNTAGTYTVALIASNTSGSSTPVNQQVIVSACPLPVAVITAPTTSCTNGTIPLLSSSSTGNPTGWTWSVSPATGWFFVSSSAISQNPTINFTIPNTYVISLTVTNAFGTSQVVTHTIVANNCVPPVASFTPSSVSACTNDVITFTNQSTGTGVLTYAWDFGNTNTSSLQIPPSQTYSTPGNYSVTLTVTDGGVTNSTTTIITIASCSPPVPEFNIDQSLCIGDCINLTATATENPTSWVWTMTGAIPATSSVQNPGNVCFPSAGTFLVSLLVTNPSGSTLLEYAVIVDNPVSVAITSLEQTIQLGESATLTATGTGIGVFSWNPSVSNPNPSIGIVSATPESTTDYIVTYSTPGGCIDTDTTKVIVEFVENIGVPGSFSPNGDGENDFLKPYGSGILSYEIRIYNRYGETVYVGTEVEGGWDGTFKGVKQNPAGFVYTLECKLRDNSIKKLKGSISLVK